MNSCIYRGIVTHRRQQPVEHHFRYSLFWLFLDLDEWESVKRKVAGLSDRRFAPASFCRADHMGDPAQSLSDSIRQFAAREAGINLASGSIRLLTQPRSFGFYFSPLNLYYCFDEDQALTAIVAEVNNTPWGEQHCYLLWQGNCSEASRHRYRHGKTFHVSPFMEMNQDYAWSVGVPGESLSLKLEVLRGGTAFFSAGMELARHPLTSVNLAASLARSPVNAVRVLVAIYYQALRLWIKKCPYYPHPKTKAAHKSAV